MSAILSLVFFTTIVFGALMPFFINFFKSFDKNEEQSVATQPLIHHDDVDQLNTTDVKFDYLHPNFSTEYLLFL